MLENEIIVGEKTIDQSKCHYVSCFYDNRLKKNFQKKF